MNLKKRIRQIESILQIVETEECNDNDKKNLRFLHPKKNPSNKEILDMWRRKYHCSRTYLYDDCASRIANILPN